MPNDRILVEAASGSVTVSDAARGAVPVSDAATGLRVVLDLLLQDMALEPVDPATLPWHEPILILRSADMERFRAVLRQIVSHCPAPMLHVLSHARDEEAIRYGAPCDFTFHAYPTPGRYRLAAIPASMLDRLQSMRFGALLYLDPGTSADLFGDVEALFAGIEDHRMVTVRDDGTFARASQPRLRRRAESAFLGLIEWYQLKLDPGFTDAARPATPTLDTQAAVVTPSLTSSIAVLDPAAPASTDVRTRR
jgi:hypothetical protein